jgi:hypothetical protein
MLRVLSCKGSEITAAGVMCSRAACACPAGVSATALLFVQSHVQSHAMLQNSCMNAIAHSLLANATGKRYWQACR